MENTAFDPKTTKEDALGAIQSAGAQANRLIALWLEHDNAPALAEISARGSGAARKAARRALKVLKSRGIEVPRERRVAKVGGSQTESAFKAWLLAPDPAFNTLFVLAKGSHTSRWRTAFVFVNDGYGVTQVQQGEFSQSGLKKAIEGVAPGIRYKPTEVDIGWARSRIHAQLARQRERGLIEPLGLTSIADLLQAAPASETAHPFDAEGLEVALDDAREMSKNSGQLHQLPEFAAWLPPRPAIDEMLVDVGKGLTPGQQPEQTEMQELLRAAVVRATDRYFSPEERTRLVRVMKDSALSVLAREGETGGLRIAAVIRCIESAGLITDPPSEVPFLKAFFDKAIAYLLTEGKGSLQIPVPNAGAPAADPEQARLPAESVEPPRDPVLADGEARAPVEAPEPSEATEATKDAEATEAAAEPGTES